jgi:hypothetical protein
MIAHGLNPKTATQKHPLQTAQPAQSVFKKICFIAIL